MHEFKDRAALDRWYSKHHAKRRPSSGSSCTRRAPGLPSVSNVEGFDVALCWGWIDAHPQSRSTSRASCSATRRAARRSIWSTRNQAHRRAPARPPAACSPRARPQIDRARADGRWDKAYGGFTRRPVSRRTCWPPSRPSRRRSKLFGTLNAQNRYALGFRTHNMKTAAGRAKKIAELRRDAEARRNHLPQRQGEMTRYRGLPARRQSGQAHGQERRAQGGVRGAGLRRCEDAAGERQCAVRRRRRPRA